MKTTAKKVIGWILIPIGVLVAISSPFIFIVANARAELTVAAIGFLICFAGIWLLIWARNDRNISN